MNPREKLSNSCAECNGSGFTKMDRWQIIDKWQSEQYSAKSAFRLYRLWKWLKEYDGDYAYIPCEECNYDLFMEQIEGMQAHHDRRKRDREIKEDMLLSTIRDITLSQTKTSQNQFRG